MHMLSIITNKTDFTGRLYEQANRYLATQRFGKYASIGGILKSLVLIGLYGGAYLYFLNSDSFTQVTVACS